MQLLSFKKLAFLASTLLCTGTTNATLGQPGTLDPTWAASSPLGAGKVRTSVGISGDRASAIALQPDGKLVLIGSCTVSGYNKFCALRYNIDGALDPTFGIDGKVITAIGRRDDYATAVALQPDGKLLIAGSCFGITNPDFCAVRYKANGTLDTTFGANGTVVTPVGAFNDTANALVLQPDGKLVLAGYCVGTSTYDFCALRYNADGTLDTTFGTNGTVITPIGNGADLAYAFALDASGRLLLAGTCGGPIASDFCALRYSANGTLDASFGSGGTVVSSVGTGNNFANALALQPDGKLVLAGYCSIGANQLFCARRYDANGAVDTSFGSGGTVVTPVGASGDIAHALALQSDGKLVLAGYCFNSPNNNFCALRYNGNGTLDPSFGSGGTVITPISTSSDYAYAIALQPDGKLVLAGGCLGTTKNDFCAVRYDGGPNTPKTLTEYVYSPLNYYFLTSRDTDKALLDVTPGWARTGQSFSSLSFLDTGSVGITRYYFDQVAKNQTRGSHFYTLVDSEKTALGVLNPTNQPSPRLPYNEGIDSYAFQPVVERVGGRCAAGQTPVYRAFRGQSRFPDDPNHRFTTSITLYNQLVAQGWDGEGVKMCAPN